MTLRKQAQARRVRGKVRCDDGEPLAVELG
jgi:hypothetical protein